METATPDRASVRRAIKAQYPTRCWPTTAAVVQLAGAPDPDTIASFRETLGELGYAFQFITLAGFHSLNAAMFELAAAFAEEGMPAYVRLQEREFELERSGYTATRHQREVGTGYFDLVTSAITPDASTVALHGSTESEQFAGLVSASTA
jgi:isocitrate lyase